MQRKRIQRVLDHETISDWEKLISDLDFNRFEGQALRGFLEEMGHLVDHRDAIDRLRAEFVNDGTTMLPAPTLKQMRPMYSSTKIYFDTYYSALSHLSSVVARFSKVFGGVAHMENKPFLAWLKRHCESLPPHLNVDELAFKELESARLFRAVLNHPQQFSPPDWSTSSDLTKYGVVHLVMHGAQQRRTGKIPEGSTREGIPPFIQADWKMDAPDEVSVTNCLANVAATILSEVLAHRRDDAGFVRVESRINEARESFLTAAVREVRPGANITVPPAPIKDEAVSRAELRSWLESRN